MMPSQVRPGLTAHQVTTFPRLHAEQSPWRACIDRRRDFRMQGSGLAADVVQILLEVLNEFNRVAFQIDPVKKVHQFHTDARNQPEIDLYVELVLDVEERGGDVGHLIIYAEGQICTDDIGVRRGVVDKLFLFLNRSRTLREMLIQPLISLFC